jgi:hypothetical protein
MYIHGHRADAQMKPTTHTQPNIQITAGNEHQMVAQNPEELETTARTRWLTT